MLSWISSDTATQISALATCVSAATSIVLAIYTWKLANLTRTLAEETRNARIRSESADVQCSIEPHEAHATIAELVIANVGSATARNVKVIAAPNRTKGGNGSPEFSITITRLLPGARIKHFLNTFPTMKQENKTLVRAQVNFEDNNGSHSLTFEQDIVFLMNLRRVSDKPQYKIASSLDSIARTLNHWNGFNRLHVNIYNAKDRQNEQKQREQADAEADIWLEEQAQQALKAAESASAGLSSASTGG